MDFSLILPVYNEENNIDELCARIKKVVKDLRKSVELIFVNDASTDSTLAKLMILRQKNKSIKIINFSRNFGHQVAVTAGLQYASGKFIGILDADLQDPPELLPKMFQLLKKGNDVVYAVRKKRKENILKKFAYGIFYRILQNISDTHIPVDSGDFCVMTKQVLEAINSLPERNRFVRGLRSWVGFKQIGFVYERRSRHAGKSKYSFGGLIKLAFDGFFSFSYIPLRIMFILGLVALSVSLIGVIMVVYAKFFTNNYRNVPGFATTIILVMFIGGLQLFSLGLVGEYMSRMYDEIKHRPQYIIQSKIGF